MAGHRCQRHRRRRVGHVRPFGLDVGDSEDETFWRGFLTSPTARAFGGVRLVISDQHAGLVKALKC